MLPQYNWEELRNAPHWSFSSLNQILNICSQQYAYRKVDKLKPELTSINLVFGTAFHNALSYFYSALKEGELLSAEELSNYFNAAFRAGVDYASSPVAMKEGKGIDYHCELAAKMLSKAIEDRDPEDQVLGTDIALKIELPETKPLICEFDLLVENKGRLIIVDHKTAAAKWPADKAHSDMQATAYLYAFREMIQDEVLFRYDVYTKTKSPSLMNLYTDRTEKDFQRFLKLVKSADRIVENDLYYPSESFYCKGCSFGEACMSWSQAA